MARKAPAPHGAGQDDARGAQDSARALLSLFHLRRDAAKPLYSQLEERIVELIGQGRLVGGSILPPERQMAEALGISRGTVQQCYAALRERGLIRGHGRHGTVVQGDAERLLPGMDRLRGFTQEMAELGRRPSTRVLEHEIVSDRSIASLFGLHSEARFLRLVRIRLGDDVPLSLESAWYSLEVAPFLASADVNGSIYAQLGRQDLHLAYCDQTVEAAFPSTTETEIFSFSKPTPCLLLKRKSFLREGTMVEYVEGVFRGDMYSYRLRLDASGAQDKAP